MGPGLGEVGALLGRKEGGERIEEEEGELSRWVRGLESREPEDERVKLY